MTEIEQTAMVVTRTVQRLKPIQMATTYLEPAMHVQTTQIKQTQVNVDAACPTQTPMVMGFLIATTLQLVAMAMSTQAKSVIMGLQTVTHNLTLAVPIA
jgi:hypothetical protein